MSVSSNAMKIPPFIVMDVLERAQQIEREQQIEVIHLDRTYAPHPGPPLKSGEGDHRKIVPIP